MENTSTITATVFGMNCWEIIICHVCSYQKKKITPSVSGVKAPTIPKRVSSHILQRPHSQWQAVYLSC